MNKLNRAVAVASLLAAAPFAQAEEVTGNVALSSEYVFRGISQSSETAAISGGFDITYESGFYAGAWGSNVDFGDKVNMELDLYAGYGFDISESISADVGVLYYEYPGDEGLDYDYVEVYGSVSLGGATLGLNYSPEYYGETDTFYYVYGDYSFAITENISLDLHAGYNKFDSEEEFGTFLVLDGASEDEDYTDYSIGLSGEYAGVGLSLAYIDTNIDEDECEALCEGRVVFSVSKSL